ncbi:MAG: glycosyltransferase [Bacteroidota bacterium]
MKKKVILSVTNDLSSEQRVHKVCMFLIKNGFEVMLIGRRRKKSLPLEERPYQTKRMFLLFEKGPFFYAEYNLRLFFFLLFRKANVLVANDLDTLLANYLVTKLSGSILIYDSHEYFTGVPELKGRKIVKKIWKILEQFIFPKLKYVYTVNKSIAELYRKEYGTDVKVVRNFPVLSFSLKKKNGVMQKKELGLPEHKKIILYQGSVNVDRGLQEAVESMQYVEDAVLLIIGDGDIINEVKALTEKLKLNKKIIFHERIPFDQLQQYTLLSDIGISLDKDTNINYRYSLPNRIFDYIHANIPVLASSLIEIKKIFSKYDVGMLIENHEPKHIAEKINFMLNDERKRKYWKENCFIAARELCWENEEQVLKEIYEIQE